MKRNNIFEEKMLQYIDEVKKQNKRITRSNSATFIDGTSMGDWYYRWLLYFKHKMMNNEELTEDEKFKLRCLAEIDNELFDIGNKKVGRISLSFEDKVEEYLEKVKELKRNIIISDNAKFSDGSDMIAWYNLQVVTIKKMVKENKVTPRLIYKSSLFANIDNCLYENGQEQYGVRKLSFEEKTDEYIKKIKELKKNIHFTDSYLFSDRRKMGHWYHNYSNKIKNTVKNGSEFSLKKTRCIAEIDNVIYEINRINKELDILNKINQYLNVVRKLGRNILLSDNCYFQDECGNNTINMREWYLDFKKCQNHIDDEFKNEKTRQAITSFFKTIDEINRKNPTYKSLSLEEKLNQYLSKMIEVNHRLYSYEDYKFTDGVSMSGWYFKLDSRNRIKVRNNQEFSSNDILKANVLATIDNEEFDMKKKVR